MLNNLSSQDIRALWAMTLLAILWVTNCFTMKADSTLTATVFTIIAGLGGYQIRAALEAKQRKKREPKAQKA